MANLQAAHQRQLLLGLSEGVGPDFVAGKYFEGVSYLLRDYIIYTVYVLDTLCSVDLEYALKYRENAVNILYQDIVTGDDDLLFLFFYSFGAFVFYGFCLFA